MRNCYAVTLRIFVLCLYLVLFFKSKKVLVSRLLLYQHTEQRYVLTQKQRKSQVLIPYLIDTRKGILT